MHAPDRLPHSTLALSREPFPASRNLHVPGQLPDVRVPLREIALTNGERVVVYYTSGPCSEPTAAIDVTRGLPDVRGAWIDARGDTETYTGRTRLALDDGVKNEARQNDATIECIETLRAQAPACSAHRAGRAVAWTWQMRHARRGIVTP